MCVGCIRRDNAIFLASKFGRMIRSYKAVNLLLFHLHILLLLLHSHDETSVSRQLILALGSCHRLLLDDLVGTRWLRLARLVPLVELLSARSEVATILTATIGHSLRLVAHT